MDLCARLFFVCGFGRSLVRSCLLALLQLLLLLGVLLRRFAEANARRFECTCIRDRAA
jgi:hypothetical protein